MIKTIVNSGFVSAKTGLAFDVVMERIEVNEDGFNVQVVKRYKDTNGQYSEEVEPKRSIVFVAKADKLNLWNNVVGDMEAKVVTKFT